MSQTYFAILTAVGEAKLANAIALNVPLQISRMAVGDGGGALPVPVRTQTALIGEQYRADLNSLTPDPLNASQIIAELVIPETEGGYWLREMGLYDAAGDLIAVSNCPPSYKPEMAEGSGRTQVLRMVLIVSSTAAVQLKIDPSVVLATRAYADAIMVGHLAAADPHPQYTTEAEVNARISAELNGITDAIYRRNLVVDGACRMAQLAAKALSTSAQYGAVDLLAAWAGGAVTAGSIAQNTAGIGQLGTSLHLTGVTLTGAGVAYARHRIEAPVARELKNKTASLSVLVQHDVGVPINYSLTLRKANAVDNFSAVTQIAASAAIAVPSGTATQLVFENIAMGDCANGIEIEVAGNCGAVANKNFQFTEWQLERGAKATRFEIEAFADTIRATERYLEKSYDLGTLPGSITMNGASVGDASSVSDLSLPFRERKRAIPTITYYSALNGASGTISFSNTQIETSPSGNLAVRFSRASDSNLQVESLPGDGYMPIVHFVADARL
jgi:phage-related tail fiber protein